MKKYAKGFANITDEQFPLLAAAITGRSIDAALNYDISKSRTQEEMDVMANGILEGTLLSDLMSILSRIPSVVPVSYTHLDVYKRQVLVSLL